MMKGDNLTEQISRHPDLFHAAGQEAQDRHPTGRPTAPRPAAHPSWDVFSHASEYDVADQQRPDHDEVAMRSLQLPFAAEADVVDQRRSVPVDEDDYR
jgi:hypothetical protein